jgi:hypothetical protein
LKIFVSSTTKDPAEKLLERIKAEKEKVSRMEKRKARKYHAG